MMKRSILPVQEYFVFSQKPFHSGKIPGISIEGKEKLETCMSILSPSQLLPKIFKAFYHKSILALTSIKDQTIPGIMRRFLNALEMVWQFTLDWGISFPQWSTDAEDQLINHSTASSEETPSISSLKTS